MFYLNVFSFNDDTSSKGKKIEEALQLSKIFSDMMLGKEYDDSIDLGDIEALQGVCKFLHVLNVQH